VLTQLVAGLVMLSVLVVIHEFGHFLVARLCGVGVPVFSVGMGPRLFGFRIGETDYRLSALPIGGYVQMSGADPFGAEDPDSYVPPEKDFMKKPIWQRLAILFAGPAFNLALPFVVFTGVMMLGEPQPDTTIGLVELDSPAAMRGVQPGERVTAINGVAVTTWRDAYEVMSDSAESDVTLTLLSDSGTRDIRFEAGGDDGRVSLSSLGIEWMSLSSRVGVLDPDSPAGRAGLQTGDGITAVDGEPVSTWVELQDALNSGVEHSLSYRRALAVDDGEANDISEGTVTVIADPAWQPPVDSAWAGAWGLEPIMLYVRGYTDDSRARDGGVQLGDRFAAIDGERVRQWEDLTEKVRRTAPPPEENTSGGCGEEEPFDAERPLRLTVVRDGELTDLTLTPRMQREASGPVIYYRPLIGVKQDPNAYTQGAMVAKHYGFGPAAARATEEVRMVFSGTLTVLGQTFTGDRRLDEAVGGPVAIFAMAGESAKSSWFDFVRLMGAISLSLGIVNLLPVPVLDGGQILFYTIEGIRGRPLSLRLRERIQMVGVLLLVALVLVVTFNDITRVLTGG